MSHSPRLFLAVVLLAVRLLHCPSLDAQTPQPSDLESLLAPVIQLEWFGMSADYFFQFAQTGDSYFPDQLTRLFGLETTPYSPGQGTRLASSLGDGPPLFQLEKAFLGTGPDGAWWQVRQSSEFGEIIYEVLLSPERVPLLIRYLDPMTGSAHEVPTLIGESLAEVRGSMTSQEIRARLDEELAEDVSQHRQYAFGAPQILGEETVETPAGRFSAVHLRDSASSSQAVTDYWLSPNAPGGILRISSLPPGADRPFVLELKEIGPATRLIDSGSIVPITTGSRMGGEYASEGSPSEPVEITMDDFMAGAVGPGGVSYYALYVPERADVYIEVSEFSGDAELYYYGTDSSFEDWLSGSSGSTLESESYFVPAGTTLYFTVVDLADDTGAGEGYMISATADFLLDSTGIRLRGEYRNEPRTLYAGGRYSLTMGREALEYYRSVADRAGTLVVRMTGLPEEAILGFADADGEYSSVEWETVKDGYTLRISGVGAGDVCYYYVAGAPWTAGTEFQASVTVE